MLKNAFILILAILFCSCSTNKQEVDLIIQNAAIYSVDPSFSKYEAMAVSQGKVIELNSNEEILKKYKAHRIMDVNGHAVFPGFIDAHCHFSGYATDLWKCDLTGTGSFEEVLTRIKNYGKNAPMKWLYGRGWDQNDWAEKKFPTKHELDSLFPDRPVFLKRIDGHAALVNQKALSMAGVNENTMIDGGQVELVDGKPSGILLDNAMDLVDKIIPLIDDKLAKEYFKTAEATCFAYGLTQVHDCGITEHIADLLDSAQKKGELKMKVYAFLSDDSTYYDRWLKRGVYKTERLTVGGFKVYADGALGSRGACLLQPYSDKPEWRGFLLTSIRRMNEISQKLAGSQFQLCTHAIGDSANRAVMTIYGNVLKGRNERRWRIEHAQLVNENDFKLFAKYDIIPSVQPTHATSDMYWAGERVGPERLQDAYAYRRLLNTYGKIALGTDFPVESISPIKTFYAAVARRDMNGFPKDGFQMENGLSREETIKGMTIWASYACFQEQEKGSLEKGKVADFVILNTDLMTCEAEDILNANVLYTFVNGEEVYSSIK